MQNTNQNIQNVKFLRPHVEEKRVWNNTNVLAGFIVGALLIISFPFILFFLKLTLLQAIIVLLIYTLFYAMVLFFLLQPSVVREIRHIAVKTVEIEKPVSEAPNRSRAAGLLKVTQL